MRNKFACLHAALDRVPVEDPWTGETEPEESAAPHADGFEKALHECWGPNTAAPLTDEEGRVVAVSNNFAGMSFSAAPRLMGWLECRHPGVHAALVEGDAAARRRRGGHGNALATAYAGHILPLSSRRDARTEILWGLEDFRRRFHREAEGFWPPEGAADEAVLEELILAGLRFALLPPWAAARVRLPGAPPGGAGEVWTETPPGPDPRRAYRWMSRESPGRWLALFFYDGELSRRAQEEPLLDLGCQLAHEMMGCLTANDAAELAHLAVPAEILGQARRQGPRAVAYAIARLEEEGGVRWTNYGEYLDLFPPPQEAILRRGASRSCPHDLARWRLGCGCPPAAEAQPAPEGEAREAPAASGAVTRAAAPQSWKGPLRESLEWLAAGLDLFFEGRFRALGSDPWRARDAYAARLLDGTPVGDQNFAEAQCEAHPTRSEALDLFGLCEMQRHRQLMLAAGVWTGEGPLSPPGLQGLRHAARALELAQALGASDDLEEALLARLARVPTGRPRLPDAAAAWTRLVRGSRTGLADAAARAGLLAAMGGDPSADAPPAFNVSWRRLAMARRETPLGAATLSLCWVEVEDPALVARLRALVAVARRAPADFECRVLQTDERRAEELAREIESGFLTLSPEEFAALLRRDFPGGAWTLEALPRALRRRELEALTPRGSPERREAVEAWRAAVRPLRHDPSAPVDEALRRLGQAAALGIPPDSLPEAGALRRAVVERLRELGGGPFPETLAEALRIMEAVLPLGLHLPLWELRKLYWDFETRRSPASGRGPEAPGRAGLAAEDGPEPGGEARRRLGKLLGFSGGS